MAHLSLKSVTRVTSLIAHLLYIHAVEVNGSVIAKHLIDIKMIYRRNAAFDSPDYARILLHNASRSMLCAPHLYFYENRRCRSLAQVHTYT